MTGKVKMYGIFKIGINLIIALLIFRNNIRTELDIYFAIYVMIPLQNFITSFPRKQIMKVIIICNYKRVALRSCTRKRMGFQRPLGQESEQRQHQRQRRKH